GRSLQRLGRLGGFEAGEGFLFELVDVADDFGDGGVLFGGDLVADFDVGVEGAGEFFAFDDGDAAFEGEAADALGEDAGTFGDDDGGRHFFGVVLEGDGELGGVGDDDVGLGNGRAEAAEDHLPLD